MSTDFLKPIVSDNYSALLPALQVTLRELALGYDPATTGVKTNTPTNCLQWNSATSRWEKFNGTSWNALSSLYAINISGNATTASSAASATGGYFTSVATDPKLELHKPGVTAAMWHIGASNLVGLANTSGNGIANGGDVFTINSSTGAVVTSGNITAGGGTVTATNFAGTATYVSGSPQINQVYGKTTSISMGGSGAVGSFVCRATGASDANLAGLTLLNDAYGIYFGVRADGYVGLGGWSRPAWSWYTSPTGDMTAAGNVIAYSDPRLKENVRPIENALEKLTSLNGVRFTWKDIVHVKCKAGKSDLGILANEVEAVFPEIVSTSIEIEGESYKAVAYDKLIPVLIEAIKEQQVQIKHLQQLAGI